MAYFTPFHRRNRARSQRNIGISLLITVICLLVPGPVLASAANSVGKELKVLSGRVPSYHSVLALLTPATEPVEARLPNRYTPGKPLKKEELEARVARLSVTPAGGVANLEVGQQLPFSAIPTDKNGQAIQGLRSHWESQNPEIVSVSSVGELRALKPGTAVLTATAGNQRETMHVVVNPASAATTALAMSAAKPKTDKQVAKTEKVKRAHAAAPYFADDEPGSRFYPENAVGTPPGRTTPGADVPGPAIGSVEAPGAANFNFELPLSSLPGRGINANLSLFYNSRLWNKSTTSLSQTRMTYNIDKSWLAPGFMLGYGYYEYLYLGDEDGEARSLVDLNGTRHELGNGGTTDGSFIRMGITSTDALQAIHPDGTRVVYGAAELIGGGPSARLYPVKIVDRNGNYILITYAGASGAGPRISTIQDTMGRYIRFYYDSNNKLVTITVPGFNGSSTERQIMRFYYTTLTVNQSGLFQSGTVVSAPSTVSAIQYIYLPSSVESGNAHVGYRYNYSTYGMIREIKQFRGMTVNSTSTSSTGLVSTEGDLAAVSTYNYPTSTSSLTNVPVYTTRTDDWAGRTSSQPVYTFSDNLTTGVSTVTSPDSIVTETTRKVTPGLWDTGLILKVERKAGSTSLSKVEFTWEEGVGGQNPRQQKMEVTNDAGEKRAITYEYDSSPNFNNIRKIHEYDFSSSGLGTELRRTDVSYLTSSSYTDLGLIHLPSSVKTYGPISSTMTLFSQVDYSYDETSLSSLSGISSKMWEDPSTTARGNLTTTRTYPDVSSLSTFIDHTATYDVAGNTTLIQLDCCQQKSVTYSSSFDYAYPTSIATGTSSTTLTTSVNYDFNTGLIGQTTDANSQNTTYTYNSDSLRLAQIDYPDSGQTSYSYSDSLAADSASRYHFYITATTKLDSSRSLNTRSFFDGTGTPTQSFTATTSGDGWIVFDAEYDAMRRPLRFSNPYYCTTDYGTCSINSSGFWTTATYDNLGRVTQVTMPRGDDNNSLTTSASASYAGTVTTSTDQAGKQRRKISDALGRLIRLDEPNGSGSLGTVSSPNQSTSYQYDVLDNLVRVTQGAQDRYFKYDSLSRLIRDRQVERTPNSSYNLSDSLTGNSSWTSKYEYNSHGLVTNFNDARGIQTTYSYDGLNRPTVISYSDSTPTANYYYDSQTLPSGAPSFTRGSSVGRLVGMTYGGSSAVTGTYFGYDVMGRINVQKQVTQSNTYSLSYTYNHAGLLATETYPTGRVLTHSYDAGGRLSQISDGTTTFTSGLTYGADSNLLSETWGNGAVHSRAYNRRFQPTEIKLKQSSAGAELQRYTFAYGEVTPSTGSIDTSKNNGQVGRAEAFINGSSTREWDQRFEYDSLGRLSTAAEYQQGGSTKSWQQQFTYDRYSNRFQSGSGNTGVGFTPVLSTDISASTNRFITSGSTPITYDLNGNITQDLKFRIDSQGRGMDYTYDANGRQKTAKRIDNTGAVTSTYDAAGQRVRTDGNGINRHVIYDIFGQLVEDYRSDSTMTGMERENIYRGGQLLAVYEGASTCSVSMADFVTIFYQNGLERNPFTSELTQWTQTLTEAQVRGVAPLIGAAQSLGNAIFSSTEYANMGKTDEEFVTDLYEAFLSRDPDHGGLDFWANDAAVNGRSHTILAFNLSGEFNDRVAQICPATSSSTSTSANLKYVLNDAQGSARGLMTNNSTSSAIVARHDYLPFGEEIYAGVGLRTGSQGYNKTNRVRQKFGMTERDEVSGLDHTWFRAYESYAGRWTSPDPLGGSATNPQSLNRYAYTGNDPVNFVDPSGLMRCEPFNYSPECDASGLSPWGGGFNMNKHRSQLNPSGQEIIEERFNWQVRTIVRVDFVAEEHERLLEDGTAVISFGWNKETEIVPTVLVLMGTKDAWPPRWMGPGRDRYGWKTQPRTQPQTPPKVVPEVPSDRLDGTEKRTGQPDNIDESNRLRGPRGMRGWRESLRLFIEMMGPGVKGDILPPIILTPEIECAALKIGCGMKA